MTRTQRALVVLVPLALAFVVFIKWTWPLLVLAAMIFLLSLFFELMATTINWIVYDEWDWRWPWQ